MDVFSHFYLSRATIELCCKYHIIIYFIITDLFLPQQQLIKLPLHPIHLGAHLLVVTKLRFGGIQSIIVVLISCPPYKLILHKDTLGAEHEAQ